MLLMVVGSEPTWLGPDRMEKIPSSLGKSIQRDLQSCIDQQVPPWGHRGLQQLDTLVLPHTDSQPVTRLKTAECPMQLF